MVGGSGGAVLGLGVGCGPGEADDVRLGRRGTPLVGATAVRLSALTSGGTGLGVDTGSGLDVSLAGALFDLLRSKIQLNSF